ncbi:hypothetical protein N7451_005916 [Penicillium sp. IBT 35674x]|nr:hypothetical protein N7451_005916 [Penicillium sp. IBT 35674x]
MSFSRPSSLDSQTVDYATPEFEEFEDSIKFHELCAVASSYRDGMLCEYVKYEIEFSDGIVWIARFPLAYQCYLSEEMSASYAATLKFLKKKTTLPVPEVYGSFVRSDESNKVNATYVLTQRLEGRILPSLDYEDYDDLEHYTDRHGTKEFAQARKIHGQWTDIMLQLTCLPFDKIGSLREGPDGEYFVGSVLHPAYARFKEKTSIYHGFEPHLKGPYSSTAEYYGAAAKLGRAFSLVDPCYEDPELDPDCMYEVAGEYELFTEFQGKIINEKYANGPFYLMWDFELGETLIDDNFNIIGINEFSGLVVDLPSFCQMPEFQRSNSYCGYVDDYRDFAKIFMNRHSQYPESALHTRKVRREMMASAETVLDFEMGLFSIFAGPNLPKMFEKLWMRPYDRKVEFQRLADTRLWFKALHEKRKPRSMFSKWVSWIFRLMGRI